MKVDGVFSKAGLDPEFVRDEEARVTSGFLRLREVAATNLPIADYPLSRAGARARRRAACVRRNVTTSSAASRPLRAERASTVLMNSRCARSNRSKTWGRSGRPAAGLRAWQVSGLFPRSPIQPPTRCCFSTTTRVAPRSSWPSTREAVWVETVVDCVERLARNLGRSPSRSRPGGQAACRRGSGRLRDGGHPLDVQGASRASASDPVLRSHP